MKVNRWRQTAVDRKELVSVIKEARLPEDRKAKEYVSKVSEWIANNLTQIRHF